jgi:ribosomal subunit interface protein
MDVQITGKAIDLGAALQTHVTEALTAGVHKYFDRGAEAQVVFDKEGAQIVVEITLHLASGVFLAARDSAHDAYGAFDGAMEKLEKRVRRYKRRLKDHHANNRDPLPAETASSYVFASSAEEHDEAEDGPLVIAEQTTTLRSMTVSDAVMQLDVGNEPVVLFRNAKHGDLSVVYRREDGNIGWIDSGRQGG